MSYFGEINRCCWVSLGCQTQTVANTTEEAGISNMSMSVYMGGE